MYAKEYRKCKRASDSYQSSTHSSKAKQKKRAYRKEHRKQKRCEIVPLESLSPKFHNIVSQGPLYICTCCEQLWCKHSVIPTATLKDNNRDLQNYC